MFKNILVPVDGSEHSQRALDRATELAKITGAKLVVFHALHIPSTLHSLSHVAEETYNFIRQQVQNTGEKIIKEAMEKCSRNGVSAEGKLVWGDPAYEITREEQEGNYDLIVIGGRGMGEIKGWVLGSISRRVVRYAKCPVLVIK
ncbi:universal stress protein [Desulfovirgula thermocuniculi]|uniref:universal stress protein n=1 Tax=Desulfovirgula thermocuniculi TaxID=348842 RepID=UPI00041D87D9|nr:universal stress protein [Desulfovirgula thermocuniculi]